MEKKVSEIKRLDDTSLRFIAGGLVIGVIAGFVVSLFRLSIEKIGEHLPSWFLFLKGHLYYLPVAFLLAALLVLITGRLIQSDQNIKGSGIPQVEGQLRGQMEIRWWSVLWKKWLGGVLAVGSGLFLGREGPSIQLGASVAQGLGTKLAKTDSERKIYISAGAAAGLSAAFNAPIAGLLFVLEEVHHNFSPLVWLTSFAAALASNFISMNFFGLTPVLYLGELESLPVKHYISLVFLGIFLGLLGLCYQKVLLRLPRWYGKLKIPTAFYCVVPFCLLIPVGLFFPHYLGGGNQIIHQLGTAPLSFYLLVGLFLLRFVFSMISYGSGLPGGIFLPILTLGAVLGCIFGTVWCHFTGLDVSYIKDFIVFAMAGYFAAIGKAPLTAIILVTEMNGSIIHLMPLGVVSLVAYMTVDFFGGQPIYEALLERMIEPDFGNIKGRKTIVEFPITAESGFAGQMIRDFVWPKEMLLTSIRRGEAELLTRGDTVMLVGDTLLILTDTGISQKIKVTLQQMEQNQVGKTKL
ncbi:ClC family H(+)/Cl(-) exchange transporter [Enterococcus nangangensis]|uniref:ClC family H(+)/Cl(-) exchange transporter n=1 Tax=Enterococcus nangangensis TaxID=2559926 RepID=UPI0010F8EA1E|nr:ClC family H(+)/Cl(-) exchange transporter [Enterococcus nangangensis]